MTDVLPPDQTQRDAAVSELDRNVVVLAGAGTGKTRLLINRLAALILGKEIPVDRIVGLTFTKKAAEEMRVRLEARLRDVIDGKPDVLGWLGQRFRQGAEKWADLARAALDAIPKAQIGTIHSFAGHLLRLYPLQAGVDPSFREDEGGVFETVFEREWLRWLAVELGDAAPRAALWHRALRRGPLSDLRALAEALVSPMVEDVVLERKADLSSTAARWREEVTRLRRDHPEKPKAYSFNPAVAALEILFSDVAEGKRVTSDRLDLIAAVENPPTGWEETKADFKRLKRAAAALVSVDDDAVTEAVQVVRPLVKKVREELARAGAMSFDGLLVGARNLVRDHADVRAALKKRFDAFLVDEFQDTDPLQGEILFYLAEAPEESADDWRRVRLGPGRLFVVGDPKQSIYRFRGADIAAFEAFEECLREQGALPVTLSANFRSKPGILDFVNGFFPSIMKETRYRQPPYAALIHPLPGQDSQKEAAVSFLRVGSSEETRLLAESAREGEAELIAERIKKDVSAGRWRHGDVALLFRSSNPFPAYIQAFRRRGIPYLAEGEKSFYRTPEIADFFNLAAAVADPDDRLSLAGVLRSPVGGLTDPELLRLTDAGGLDYRRAPRVLAETVNSLYARLRDLARDAVMFPVPVFLERLLARTAFLELVAAGPSADQAYANIMKAIDLARTWAEEAPLTLRGFLRRFARYRDDRRDEGENPLADANVNAVRLFTIHKAKGLEFPVVFLPNLNAGLGDGQRDRPVIARDWRTGRVGLRLPKARLQSSAMVLIEEEIAEREKAEEVRVFYVATTRAGNEMILVGSEAAARGPVAGYLKSVGAWPDAATASALVGNLVVPVEHAEFREIDWSRSDAPATSALSPAWKIDDIAKVLHHRKEEAERVSALKTFQSPSSVLNEGEKIRVLDEDSPAPVRQAVDVGHLCHKVLEEWNFSARAKPSKAALAAGLENAARQLELLSEDADRPALMAEARKILADFFKSSAYQRLRQARFLGREIPFIYKDGEGEARTIMHGVIDALIEIDGRVVIIDYKSNIVTAATQKKLVGHYRPQGDIYREAFRRATGKNADFELLFLRTGEMVLVKPEKVNELCEEADV